MQETPNQGGGKKKKKKKKKKTKIIEETQMAETIEAVVAPTSNPVTEATTVAEVPAAAPSRH